MTGLQPLAGVRVETADGAPVIVAETSDPQLLWRPPADRIAEFEQRGAVRVRVRMRALEGRLVEPCLYGDWGDGFSEASWKPMAPVERGVWSAVAHSDAGSLCALRFDPSTTPGRFVIDAFDVDPAGPVMPQMRAISPARRLARRLVRRAPGPLAAAAHRLRSLLSRDPARRAAALRGLGAGRLGGGGIWREDWARRFDVARRMRSPLFAAPPLTPPAREVDGPRVVAFYLPQYHPIPENDAWWGRGFTEWSNVAKATPQFVGHLQPKLPADLGFYDLRVPEVRRQQAELARLSGVDAFCFHFYWFGGRRVLEGPLDAFAADNAIDLPFALCWANENWTRRWDGQEQDVLLAQRHSPEDDRAVLDEMARYMRHRRYLRSGGRPVLVVYRPDTLPEPAETVRRWRDRAREIGLGELFLLCTDAFGFADHAAFGFDGRVEFPPHAIAAGEIGQGLALLNPGYTGRVYDYEAVAQRKIADLVEREDSSTLPGVMPAWDNEARKPGGGNVFHNATPDAFRRWAAAALDSVTRLRPPKERFVFVNAWNEWAEGAYLEPDRWFGHAFAQALRSAVEARAPRTAAARPMDRRSDAVVLLHLFYPELIDEMAARLRPHVETLDVDVSFPNVWPEPAVARLASAMPWAALHPTENLGRDVGPFLRALARADAAGYPLFCKVHGKRSPHLAEGDADRERLLTALLGPDAPAQARAAFAAEAGLGLLAPEGTARSLGDADTVYHNKAWLEELSRRIGLRLDVTTRFAAGTMFWGRTAAFRPLLSPEAARLEFEPEMGRIDGTLAHALERAMGAVVAKAGYVDRYAL